MFFQDTRLNEQQNLVVKAVVKSVAQPSNRIILLQGPPGTGKSHVIVATIMKIYAVDIALA
jgi:DNA replication protein DnaC